MLHVPSKSFKMESWNHVAHFLLRTVDLIIYFYLLRVLETPRETLAKGDHTYC